MKQKLWGLAVIILVIIAGAAIFHHVHSQPVAVTNSTVKIAYLPVAQALPLYVAIEKGYFKDAGITVDPIRFDAPNQIIDALLGGQADVGAPGSAAGITAVAESKKPNSLKIFALEGSDSTHLNDAFLVAPSSAIHSIQDLRGKKLAHLPGIQWRTIATDILAKNGLVAGKDVQLVELAMPLQIPALADGQVDALLTFEPTVTVALAKNAARVLVSEPAASEIATPFYPGSGDIATAFAKTNPALATKIIAIFQKATNDINQDPTSTRQFLTDYTPLDSSLAAIVPLPTFKMYNDLTDTDVAALQKFYDIFVTNHVIDAPVSARDLLWSDSYAPQNSH